MVFRRIPFVVSLAGLVVVLISPPASAGVDMAGQYVESSATPVQIVGSDGRLVAGTKVVERTLDATGQVLSTETFTQENPPYRAATNDQLPFACISDGYRNGFTAYERREAIYRGKNDFAQALFFPYAQQNAREFGGGPTQQWLVCGVGGTDPNNGSRITKSGPGIAYKDRSTTYKLGQTWKEGSTPANYTVTLGFQTEGPVKVNGGISQTPQDLLKGSPRPPQSDDEMDIIARNGVNGWWQHHCEPHCGGNGSVHGTSDFQGSVVEGLWEFPVNKSVRPDDFLTKIYWTHDCANAFGVCG